MKSSIGVSWHIKTAALQPWGGGNLQPQLHNLVPRSRVERREGTCLSEGRDAPWPHPANSPGPGSLRPGVRVLVVPS